MEFETILRRLVEARVDFILIGGVAAAVQGSIRPTFDIDFCYGRSLENLRRLENALAPATPRLRGAPDELPFKWDAQTLEMGLNFTLDTDWGAIDLIGDVPGISSYERVTAFSETIELYGMDIQVLSLDGLILAKRAAGRIKDREQLIELLALKELRS